MFIDIVLARSSPEFNDIGIIAKRDDADMVNRGREEVFGPTDGGA
jgi:hypothetical protein